jgi:hypothetical protein
MPDLTLLQPFNLNTTGNFTFANTSVTGNLSSGNANLGNLVSANYFSGNGSLLTGLPAGYANSNVAAYLPTYTGNVSANYFIGNGSTLTNITGSNVDGNVTSAVQSHYANIANSVAGSNVSGQVGNALVAGTVYTNAQPNITSVGTLSSLTVTGNITGGNFVTTGKVYASDFVNGGTGIYLAAGPSGYINFFTSTGDKVSIKDNGNIDVVGTANVGNLITSGNITSGNANLGNLATANYFSGNGSLLTGLPAGYANSNVAAYLPTYTGNFTAGNANISGSLVTGTITTAADSGNISGANYVVANYFSGNGSLLTSLTGANVTGYVPLSTAANTAATVTTNAQPNITSVGTLSSLSVSGDATVTGNFTVGGTTTYINVETFRVEDPLIELGGGANGDPLTTNDGKDRGTLLHYYTTGVVDAFMGWDNSNGEFAFGSNVSVSSEVVTFNNFGNIRASYFIGNGSQLTGTIANANYSTYAGTVITSAQPNITSVGTLASLTVTGNITSGNADLGNLATASYFTGNGSLLTYITGSNVNGNVTSAVQSHYANIANSIAGSNVDGQVGNALISGTVYTNAQPNITSVGSLNSLTVTGLITATGTGLKAANVQDSSGTITITTKYNNVSGDVGIYGNLNVGTSGTGFFIGNGSYLSGLTGSNVSGQVGNALVAGTVYTNAQPNITSVGTLESVTATGNISGNYILGNGIYLTGITSAGVANGTSNISIPTVNGNINLSSAGNANIVVVTGTGVNVAGTMNVTSNVSGSYFVGNGFYLTGLDAAGRVANGTSNLSITTSGGNITMGVGGTANVFIATTTGVNIAGTLNVATGTITSDKPTIVTQTWNNSSVNFTGIKENITITNAGGDSLLMDLQVSSVSKFSVDRNGTVVTGNITAKILKGTSNIDIPTSSGNVTISSAGNANIVVVTGTGANITGVLNVSNSANLGNLVSANYFTGTLTTSVQPNITSMGTLTSLTVNGLTNLSNVGNITITGGSANQYLKTDGTGNLSWSTVTGGGGGGALDISDDTTTNASYYPVWAPSTTGQLSYAYISSSKLQFNPSSGQLTVQDLNTLSDATLKTNAEVINDPFSVLNQLFGMGFNWLDTGKKSYGVMADKLEKILPELVSVNAQGNKTVNYIPIIAFLIEAVKLNQSEIEELKKR